MHKLFLFVSTQLQGLEGADMREGDKSHLLCQAKKDKETLKKNTSYHYKSLNHLWFLKFKIGIIYKK